MRFLSLFLLLLLSSLSAQHRDTQEKISIQLHWKYQFQFAGFIVAKERGYYKEEGLDVQLKEYEEGINIVDEVLNGNSEYGIYNSNILVEYLQNSSVKLISSYFKRSALVLITRPDIFYASELLNKSIMAGTEEDFELNFKPLFDNYNVNISQLNLVKHSYSIDDFANNRVDAMTAFISDQPYKLDKLGIKYNIINPSDYGSFNLQLELFTSEKEVTKHSRRVQKFRDATIKGWKYALKHKEEIVKLIHDKYAPKLSIDSLLNEANEIEKLILPKTYDIGSIDENFLHRQFELFQTNYKINNEIVLDDFIYKEMKAKKMRFSEVELKYIKENPTINICLHPNLYPIDGYVDGKHSGIMGEVYEEISQKLGLEFTPVPTVDYTDLHSKINSKECKIVSILPTKNKHFPNLKMTKSFFKTHFTLISTLDKSFVQDTSELKDKKLIVQFEGHKNKILHSYPYLDIEVQNDVNKMMQAILDEKAFAVIAANEVSDYLIDKYGYGKLKINGFVSKENVIYAGTGVQKDEPILYSIIQKALDDISTQKIDEIVSSWRLTRYHSKTDYSLVIRILIGVTILILIMIYYHRKLKIAHRELEKKVKELSIQDEILTKQSKQAVMGEMLSMIAHQWRQPLSTITLQISNLQISKLMGSKIDEKEMDDTLSKISDSIIYLSQTIDDFKTYFNTDKKTTNVEIHSLLQKVVNFALPRVESSLITIEIKNSKLIYLNTYPNELVQVILNILNNAIDAFEDLEREEKYINLYVKREVDKIAIYVEDNGCGISQENLSKLFEPYFSTKGKNGTGLGLYMSQMILQKQFGGDIRVESSQRGTTFIIEVPKV